MRKELKDLVDKKVISYKKILNVYGQVITIVEQVFGFTVSTISDDIFTLHRLCDNNHGIKIEQNTSRDEDADYYDDIRVSILPFLNGAHQIVFSMNYNEKDDQWELKRYGDLKYHANHPDPRIPELESKLRLLIKRQNTPESDLIMNPVKIIRYEPGLCHENAQTIIDDIIDQAEEYYRKEHFLDVSSCSISGNPNTIVSIFGPLSEAGITDSGFGYFHTNKGRHVSTGPTGAMNDFSQKFLIMFITPDGKGPMTDVEILLMEKEDDKS